MYRCYASFFSNRVRAWKRKSPFVPYASSVFIYCYTYYMYICRTRFTQNVLLLLIRYLQLSKYCRIKRNNAAFQTLIYAPSLCPSSNSSKNLSVCCCFFFFFQIHCNDNDACALEPAWTTARDPFSPLFMLIHKWFLSLAGSR